MSIAIEEHLKTHHTEKRNDYREAMMRQVFDQITNLDPPPQTSKSIEGILTQPFRYATNMQLVRGNKHNQHDEQDINNFLQQFKGKKVKITIEELL